MRDNQVYDNILSHATDAFRERGYHSVGIADLLKECGISRGSLYYYFPNGKEELASAVIKNLVATSSDKLQRLLLQTDLEPLSALQNYIIDLADEIDEGNCNISVHLFLLDISQINEELRQECEHAIDTLDFFFYTKIKECDLSVDATKKLSDTVVSMILGAANNCVLKRDSQLLRSLADGLPTLFAGYDYQKK